MLEVVPPTVRARITTVSALAMRSFWAKSWLTGTPAHAGYQVGDLIDLPLDWFSQQRRTIVLFVRSGCGACQPSASFLEERLRTVAGDSTTRVLAVLEQTEPDIDWVLRALGLTASQTVTLDSRQYRWLRLAAVPTLLIVNTDGTIVFAHVGTPSVEDTARIDRALQDRTAS